MNEHEAWIKAWIGKAEADYETAVVVFDSGKPLFDAVCFHCQQCVEKYLKAFLLQANQAVSKSHDLERLLQACIEIDASLGELEDSCLVLNDYAVGVRYPDDAEETTSQEAADALLFTKIVREGMRTKFPFLTPPPDGFPE